MSKMNLVEVLASIEKEGGYECATFERIHHPHRLENDEPVSRRRRHSRRQSNYRSVLPEYRQDKLKE